MKKIIAVIVAIALLTVILVGCGNMNLGMGNYTFEKVHIDTYHYHGCFTIEMWNDCSSGIEVKTKEAGTMFLSEGTYVLIEGNKACPFCEKGE